MLKEILKKLGVDPAEDISDEDAKRMIEEQIEAKNTQISQLESDKDSLSKSVQELTTSVEGYKSREETTNKELTETKAKLDQITELYKENFTKDSESQEEVNKTEKELGDDVLQQLLETN